MRPTKPGPEPVREGRLSLPNKLATARGRNRNVKACDVIPTTENNTAVEDGDEYLEDTPVPQAASMEDHTKFFLALLQSKVPVALQLTSSPLIVLLHHVYPSQQLSDEVVMQLQL